MILSVRADAFTYAIGDNDPVAAANSIDLPVEKRSNVTLAYTGADTFEAWTNSSDKVLKTTEEYTFPVYISTFIQASTVNAADGVPVIFMTEYDQIYTIAHVKNGAITEGMPATPYRLGATASWDKTEAEIVAEAANAESFLVTLTKTMRDDVYTVVVNDSESGDELFASEQLLGRNCHVTLPEENFLYVKLGDAVLSYVPDFMYFGNGATTMTAYYGTDAVEAESLVTMTVAEGATLAGDMVLDFAADGTCDRIVFAAGGTYDVSQIRLVPSDSGLAAWRNLRRFVIGSAAGATLTGSFDLSALSNARIRQRDNGDLELSSPKAFIFSVR